MPLETSVFYNHIVGYVFIFCAISVYAVISSAYYPLLIFDIGILVLYSLFILALNSEIPEELYAQIPVSIFAISSLFISSRMNAASVKFVNNERALKKAAAKAAESSKAKAEFLAVMSHEIRTPMVGIMGMVDFLQETKLSKEQEEHLQTITQCSKTLLNTINDILDLSKLEAGQMQISPIDFDLESLLNGIEKTFQNLASQKGLDFQIDLEKNVPKHIHADPNRIQQIMMNLINNAIKFTNDGSVKVEIGYKDKIRVEVKDTGVGISKDKQAKLFQKFSQVDGSISRKYGGTGLGLYIAQNLVESMGGKIGFNSELGAGSCFWFEIPYREPIGDKDFAITSENIDQHSFTTMKILLVDDNALNRDIISRYLGKFHTVTALSSGIEAIDLLEKEEFDLVLMDLQMPELDGFETTMKIKRINDKCRKMPILAMSANVLEKDIIKCRQVGMVDHISKPVDQTQMFTTIQKYAEHASPDLTPDRIAESSEAEKQSSDYTNDTIDYMIEQLGSDYVTGFLQDSDDAINTLIEELQTKLEEGDDTEAASLAHNMVSLLGNIGFSRSAHVAQSIEKLCKDEALIQAKETFALMRGAVEDELKRLRDSYFKEK